MGRYGETATKTEGRKAFRISNCGLRISKGIEDKQQNKDFFIFPLPHAPCPMPVALRFVSLTTDY
jgi:hypothetical protein